MTPTALSIKAEILFMLFSPLIMLGVFELVNRLLRHFTRHRHSRMP